MRHGQVPVGMKGCVPRLSPLLVPRPQIEERLADAHRTPVTLVCGPPGSGKSTLLARALVAPAVARSVTWLCLDERDNDTGRLLALLQTALAEDAAVVPQRSLLPARDALDELLGDLAAGDRQHVLVLDDLQVLRAPAALDLIAHLLRHAPPPLDVVLAGRADPPVGLEDLRLDGRLGEIRNADLALTRSEAADLLALHEVVLDTADVTALWERTAGWAAGLRLAACALQNESDPGRFVRSASRTAAVLSDYLLRELLVRQDDRLQWFLLRTSVADRLTPELAALLSDDVAAAHHLAELERSGILVADAEDDRWYRYHPLFGTLLRARLTRHDPALAAEMHGRAAQWCLEHDLPGAAEAHAQSAEDWEVLGELAAWRWVDAAVQGLDVEGDLLPRDLDPSVVAATPGLALVASADACRRLNRDEAELFRRTFDDLVEPGPTSTAFGTERLVLDVAFGCTFGSDERSLRAAAQLRETAVVDPAAVDLRRLGALREAELILDAGDIDRGRALLVELADRGDSCWITAEASALLALVHAVSGRHALAVPLVDVVLDRTRGCASTQAGTAARLASIVSLVQRGELRSATETLTTAKPVGGGPQSRLVRLSDQIVRLGLGAVPGRAVTLDADVVGHPIAGLALRALGVVEVVTPGGRPLVVGGPGEMALVEARGRLAAGDVVQADQAVCRWLAVGSLHGAHPRTLVEATTVAAIAAAARHDQAATRRLLCETLDLRASTGVVAPLMQYGERLAPLLQCNLSELGDRMGPALELLDRMRPASTRDLVEPLTDRELEVLVHLPTLMSNAEIAADLYLSVNTVKTHLKAVYRKLGVEGRRQAVVRGRELELI